MRRATMKDFLNDAAEVDYDDEGGNAVGFVDDEAAVEGDDGDDDDDAEDEEGEGEGEGDDDGDGDGDDDDEEDDGDGQGDDEEDGDDDEEDGEEYEDGTTSAPCVFTFFYYPEYTSHFLLLFV